MHLRRSDHINYQELSAFSTVEILLVLIIIASLSVMTLFSLNKLHQQQRLKQVSNAFQMHYLQAQQLAIGYAETITLCPFSNHNYCGTDWREGWQIRRQNGEVLANHKLSDADMTIFLKMSLARNQNIQFAADGSTFGQQGRIYFCNSSELNNIAYLVNPTGYLTLEKAINCS